MYKSIPTSDCGLLRFVIKLQEHTVFHKVRAQLRQFPDLQYSMILFCCWYASLGQGRLTKQEMQQLYAAISDWHGRITQQMIKLTIKLEQAEFPMPLKQNIISQIEFAEQTELLMLNDVLIKFAKLTRNPQQKLTEACKNIALYCKLQSILVTPSLCELFYQLLACIFPTVDLLETHTVCEKIFYEETEFGCKQEKLYLN